MLSELFELEMMLQTILIMKMLICWLKVNVENIAYLPPLLLPSLKLCYVVLKLEISNSVAGGDFFPVIFRLVNLICNVWLVKLINYKTCINLWTCKTNFCKETKTDFWQETCTFVNMASFKNFPQKAFLMMMSDAHISNYII